MADWLEKLASTLPVAEVYKDLAQPAFRELGSAALNATKAARFVIAPLDYLAAHQERWQRWLKRLADKVPEENLVPAHPQIAGPAIERMKYLEEESILAEMFINLLARAVDSSRVSEAHPAFVQIISQISPDEAFVVAYLSKGPRYLEQIADFDREKNLFGPRKTVENAFPLTKLGYPENYFLYTNHLNSLGIAGVFQDGNQEPIKVNEIQVATRIRCYARLTEFGEMFARSCMPDDVEEFLDV